MTPNGSRRQEAGRLPLFPAIVAIPQAEATFENGIVRIALSKAERTKPEKFAIKGAKRAARGHWRGCQ